MGNQCDSCFSSRGFSKQSCFDSSSVAFVLSFGLSEELYLRFVIKISFHYLGSLDRLWLFAHIDDSKCCIWTGLFSGALYVLCQRCGAQPGPLPAIEGSKYIVPVFISLFRAKICQYKDFYELESYYRFKVMAFKCLNSVLLPDVSSWPFIFPPVPCTVASAEFHSSSGSNRVIYYHGHCPENLHMQFLDGPWE